MPPKGWSRRVVAPTTEREANINVDRSKMIDIYVDMSLRSDVLFAGADAIRGLHRQHEHAAVADLAGPRRFDDRANRLFGNRVRHHDFDLHLREQADVVLLAAIDRRVPLLL